MTTITTYEEAKAANQAAGQHFFSNDSRGVYGLRVLDPVYPVDGGAFVVVSARRDRAAKRLYSVRYIANADGKLHMLLDNGRQGAFAGHQAAKTWQKTWQHGCQICRSVGHGPHEPCKE